MTKFLKKKKGRDKPPPPQITEIFIRSHRLRISVLPRSSTMKMQKLVKDSSATDRSNEFNGHSPPPLRPLSTRRAACSIRSNDRERGRGWRGRKESNFSPSNRGEVYIEPGSKMRNCLSITRYSGGGGGRGIIDDAEKSTNPISCSCNLPGN